MSSKTSPTSSWMPVKGSGCGIRPDLDQMSSDVAFDFSKSTDFFQENQKDSTSKEAHAIDTKKVRK